MRRCELEANSCFFNHAVPSINTALGVGDVIISQHFIQCIEHGYFFFNQMPILYRQYFVTVAFEHVVIFALW